MCPVLYHEYRSVWRARRGAPSSFFHEYDLLHHHGSFLFWHSLPCFWQALPCKLTSHMHTVRCHSVLPWKYHAPTRPGLIQTGASGTWCLQVPPARSVFSSADQPMKKYLAHRRLHRTSKVLAILLGFWKLRNFLRPISASMKEAKAKRHTTERTKREHNWDFVKDWNFWFWKISFFCFFWNFGKNGLLLFTTINNITY